MSRRSSQNSTLASWLHPSSRTVDNDTATNAAWRAALEAGASAIICITRTGFTVRSIARFRPQAKILGFSTDPRTVRQLTMSWGARPYLLERAAPIEHLVQEAIDIALRHAEIRHGDLVAVLHGSDDYPGRATDTLRMIRVDR